MRSLLAEGAIGAPLLLRVVFGFSLDEPGNIRLRPDLGGGALLDIGCYALHAARLLLGEPLAAEALALVGPTGVDTLVLGSLLFPGGAAAQFSAGIALPRRVELELVGDAGSLFLTDPFQCREPRVLLRGADGERELPVEQASHFELQFAHLAALAAGRAPLASEKRDAVAQAAVLSRLAQAIEAHPGP